MMFHSAGYFRGVLCPFFEHGLCHRPHCHYRHAKPAQRSSVKKLPKLRSRLVTPQLHKGQSTPSSEKQSTDEKDVKKPQPQDEPEKPDKPVSSTSSSSLMSDVSHKVDEIPGGAEVCDKVVTEVSKLIGEISSFYGSATENYPTCTSEETGSPGQSGTATPSPPPRESSKQIAEPSLPSYAPENCLSVDSSYGSAKEATKNDGKQPPSSESVEVAETSSEDSLTVAMLESVLVTEKDIFGDTDVMSDDNDDGEVGGGAINSNIDDDVISEQPKLLSAEELANIEQEFKKVTSLPSVDQSVKPCAVEKKKTSNFVDVSLKKKWKAHSSAEVVREPVKLQTASVVNSNFTASLDKSSLYMGRKRLAKPAQEAPAAKRPKLQLTTNAKIPTKFRQRFLDSFIDEFLKTDPHPEQAYQKALDEEKVLFERSSSRMIYMNVSTLALKRIRNQTLVKLNEMRKKSDARVEALVKSGEGGSSKKMEGAGSTPGPSPSSVIEAVQTGNKTISVELKSSEVRKTSPAVEAKKKKGWQSLEAELQAAFTSEAKVMPPSASTGLTGYSSTTSGKSSTTSLQDSRAVFSSSAFYSKKVDKPATAATEAEAKLKKKKKKLKTKTNKSLSASAEEKGQMSSAAVKSTSRDLAKIELSSAKRQRKSFEDSPISQASSEGPITDRKEKLLSYKSYQSFREMDTSLMGRLPTKKARPSIEETPVIREGVDNSSKDVLLKRQYSNSSMEEVPVISTATTSADSARNARRSGSGNSFDDPIDLTEELFGASDSDSGRGEETMEMPVFQLANECQNLSEEGECEDEGVGSSFGISFENALNSLSCGKASKKKQKLSRNKSRKKKKMKNKCKVSSTDGVAEKRRDRSSLGDELRRSSVTNEMGSSANEHGGSMTDQRGSSLTEEGKSKVSLKLDLSLFNLKSPTLCLAKTPVLTPTLTQQHSVQFPPSSPEMASACQSSEDSESNCGPLSPREENDGAIPLSTDKKETAGSSKKPMLPSYLPSGPLINLTKMAAKHKQQKSSVSLLGKKRALPKAPPTTSTAPTRGTYSIIKRKEIELTASRFFSHMKSYLLTEDQLIENGYPRPTSVSGKASIHRESSQSPDIHPVGPNAMQHYCCRCSKPFIIYNSGQYQSLEECVYHYGRLIKTREYGEGMVSIYTCCQGRRDSAGCLVAKFHVTAGERPTLDDGYVTTEAPPTDSAYQPTVYALDCEMCYTTIGLQLTRVSVINMNFEPIYEKLIKPSHPIVDYNTRFSGLTADDFVGIATGLEDVQQELLQLFFSDTILLGHSLESDLRALKIIHSSVVDTAIVFPHRKGPPYKRALKTLMAEYMQKFIQDSIDGGHDSLEDSKACMELMIWKVKQDLKRVSRTSMS